MNTNIVEHVKTEYEELSMAGQGVHRPGCQCSPADLTNVTRGNIVGINLLPWVRFWVGLADPMAYKGREINWKFQDLTWILRIARI